MSDRYDTCFPRFMKMRSFAFDNLLAVTDNLLAVTGAFVLMTALGCAGADNADPGSSSGSGGNDMASGGTAPTSSGSGGAGTGATENDMSGGPGGDGGGTSGVGAGSPGVGGASPSGGGDGCVCSSGPCCDGCAFRAKSATCGEDDPNKVTLKSSYCDDLLESKSCSGEVISIRRIYVRRVCTGDSSECLGESELRELANCESQAGGGVCITDSETEAHCGPCPH